MKKIQVSKSLFLFLRHKYAGHIFTKQENTNFFVKAGTIKLETEILNVLNKI